MTTYGGRNTFRAGYCSPEDIQHNMQMLSNLSEAIGNPFSEGGPSWRYPQLDDFGAIVYDPDGNQMWTEESLVTPGGLARFELTGTISGTGGTPAKLLSKDKGPGTETGQEIYVFDPLSRYGNIHEGAKGYAQHMEGDSYEILSLGRPGVNAESTLTEGEVRIRGHCTELKSLADWFDTVDTEGDFGVAPDPGPGRELAIVGQNPDDCNGKLYISVPSPTPTPNDDGEPDIEEGDIVIKYDATNNQYWLPKSVFDSVDRKVAVTEGDATSAELEPKSGGDAPSPHMHRVDYAVVGGGPAGDKLRGEVPFTTPIYVGKTTSSSGVGCPTTISVQITDPPPAEDEDPTVIAGVKIVTEKPAEPNHCVLITQGGPNSGGTGDPSLDWWVIWYACDEISSS